MLWGLPRGVPGFGWPRYMAPADSSPREGKSRSSPPSIKCVSRSRFSQSEIEKLKAENDRLKSESQGSGCSRAPSQVSISASPRQSLGLSQHSLNLPESTSLGERLAAWGQDKSTSPGKWLVGPGAGHEHQPGDMAHRLGTS